MSSGNKKMKVPENQLFKIQVKHYFVKLKKRKRERELAENLWLSPNDGLHKTALNCLELDINSTIEKVQVSSFHYWMLSIYVVFLNKSFVLIRITSKLIVIVKNKWSKLVVNSFEIKTTHCIGIYSNKLSCL